MHYFISNICNFSSKIIIFRFQYNVCLLPQYLIEHQVKKFLELCDPADFIFLAGLIVFLGKGD